MDHIPEIEIGEDEAQTNNLAPGTKAKCTGP